MRGLCQYLVGLLLLATLAGCGLSPREERAAWRGDAERRCLAAGYVRPSPAIVAMRELDGPRACGMDHPFKVSALVKGSLAVEPPAVMACPAISHFEAWLQSRVQPAAVAYFGQPVVAVRIMGAYSCRPMNNRRGAKISEHAFGNAVDIGGFELADGRVVRVQTGWNGALEEQGFLKRVYSDACELFTTVLAPGSNAFHYNHIHVDLARHDARGLKRYCRPNLGPIPPPSYLPGRPQAPLVSQLGMPPQTVSPIVRQLAAPRYPAPPAPMPDDAYEPEPVPADAYSVPTVRNDLPGAVEPADLDLKAPAMPAAKDSWPQQDPSADE